MAPKILCLYDLFLARSISLFVLLNNLMQFIVLLILLELLPRIRIHGQEQNEGWFIPNFLHKNGYSNMNL